MKISGTGSALPKKVVTNHMLSAFLDTSDEWITTRTGVKSRHVISDEKLEDLAIEASVKALENAGIRPDDLDFIICSNWTWAAFLLSNFLDEAYFTKS